MQADYSVVASGTYLVEFGVTNWSDMHYDSGLAFNAVTIASAPISTVIPVPAAAWLFGSALAGIALLRRRVSS